MLCRQESLGRLGRGHRAAPDSEDLHQHQAGLAVKTLATVSKELQETWGNCTVQLFSSLKKQGVEEAEKIIGAWLNPPAAPSSEEEAVPSPS